MRAIYCYFFAILMLMMVNPVSGQDRTSVPGVIVSPNNTNHYAQYDITLNIIQAAGAISAGQDSIRVTFPEGTAVPNYIAAGNISFGGAIVTSTVKTYSNSLAFVSPQSVANGESAVIRILSTAGIRNPGQGSYTLSVLTRNTDVATSPNYSITASASTVSVAAVTPTPSLAGFPADYTIGFKLGDGGFLAQDEKIYLTFPNGTIIPDGFLSGIRVNGTEAIALKNGNTIELNAPIYFDNNQFLKIFIPKSSGLRNPDETNSPYTIGVSTQRESAVIPSSDYHIVATNQFSHSSVSISTDTVNQMSSYEISAYSGSAGAMTANSDIIEVTFPTNTFIPANLNASRITISNSEGFTSNPTVVTRVSDSVVRLTTPISIDDESEFVVRFQSALGIKNPSEPANYSISLRTLKSNLTIIKNSTNSNPYSIFSASSRLGSPQVALSSTVANANSNYTVTFKTGNYGALAGGLNKVVLEFPVGTNLGNISSATINGTTIPAGNRIVSNTTTLTITLPGSIIIDNNSKTTIVLNNVKNPVNGRYSLVMNSSAEPKRVYTADYTIGGDKANYSGNPNPSPLSVNATASYAFYSMNAFGTFQRNNNEYIRFIFPEGVIIPESMPNNSVTTGHTVQRIETNPAERMVTVYLTSNSNTFTIYTFTFQQSAGIINPALASTGTDNPTIIPDNYRVRISSSVKPNYATSGTFQIQPVGGSTLTVNQVVVTPNVMNASNAAYSIRFTPSSNGRLQGGTDLGSNYVKIMFYNIQNVPQTVNPAHVFVNGVAAQRVDMSGNNFTVFIPEGVTLEPNEQAEIFLSSNIGLKNANYAGNISFAIKADNSYGQSSGNYSIVNGGGSTPLVFNEISLSDNKVNAKASYSAHFTLGTADNISIGDEIKLTFPDNTFVPSSISKSRILVNGNELLYNTDLEGSSTLVINSPIAISNSNAVTILISSNAGLLNPSFVASNYSAVLLLKNGSTATSPTYVTTSSNSTVSIANVNLSKSGELNPAAPSLQTNYTVSFSTGDYGRLITSGNNRSTITIIFPAGTTLPTANNSAITVNGFTVPVGDRSIDNTNKTVSVVVPSGVSILNNSLVQVLIPNITNPAAASNNYTVFVRTSVEPNNVESNPYSITNNGPVTFIAAVTNNSIVNENADFTVRFKTDNQLNSGTDRIILRFPDDIGFKGIVPNNAIVLRVYQDASYSTIVNSYSFQSSDFIISPNSNTIKALVGINIPDDSYIEISITDNANIRNPREPGTEYEYKVATSQQTFQVGIDNLEFVPSILTNISALTVERSTQQPETPTKWTWRFTTGGNGGLRPGVATISLRYLNPNIVIPTTINVASVMVNQARPQSITVTGNLIQLIIPNSVTIGSSAQVEIVFSPDSGIFEEQVIQKVLPGAKSSTPPTVSGVAEYEAFTSAEPTAVENDESLPIELISFEAETQKTAESPKLIWKTATEIENYGFEVHRSYDSGDWERMAFISGAGFSTTQKVYSFIDSKATLAGTYLYRLIQIDFDGKENIFNTVEVTVEPPSTTKLLGNYPNPFNPTTKISYQLSRDSKVSVQIYDVLGRLVQTLVNESQVAGKYEQEFNAIRYSSGIYFIRFQADAKTSIKKMLLIK